jgi:hypothetical protein
MDKTIRGLLILLAMSVLLMGTALAAAYPSGATISGTTNMGRLPVNTTNAVPLYAGNITRVLLDTSMSTFRWAGLFGNASGTIKLGDNTAAVMFNWAALANMVYASTTAGTVDWATLQDAVRADMTTPFPWINAGGDSDGYNTTFTGGSESIGSNIFTLSSDYAPTLNSTAAFWKTYSLKDDNDKVVFAGKVVQKSQAYNGQTVDFQMIIPENGIENEAVANWNLWVELI